MKNTIGESIAHAVIDNVIEGIILINEHGVLQYFNPAAERLFGLSAEEVLGKNVSMLMPDPHRSRHDSYLSNYFSTGDARVIGIGREVEAVRKNGSRFPIDLSVVQTRIDGKTFFVGVVRDISDRKESERIIEMNARVNRAINKALNQFISANLWSKKELFDNLLDSLLSLTNSPMGFIGEIMHDEEGLPYLRNHAITNIAWNRETRERYKKNIRTGLDFRNLNTLFGVTLTTGEVVITNAPADDPRSGGLPPGHRALSSYMGLPIYAGSRFLGMAGVANCPIGYDDETVELIKPFLGTVGSIIAGFQNLQSRRLAEQDLYTAQQRLRTLATQDPLTGTANRRTLMEALDDAFARAQDVRVPISVMFIDIDHFKSVNDNHGHATGDLVLKQVADVLKEAIRPNDILGRYGGEEFVAGFVGCDEIAAMELAGRLREAVENAGIALNDVPRLRVTVSIGVATGPHGCANVQQLINMADEAVYAAKNQGRNRVHLREAVGPVLPVDIRDVAPLTRRQTSERTDPPETEDPTDGFDDRPIDSKASV